LGKHSGRHTHGSSIRWYVNEDDGAGANFGIIADRDRPKDDGPRTDRDAVSQGGMTASALHVALPAECDAMVKRTVVADYGGFTDNDTGSVVDEQAIADRGSGVNFDERPRPHDLRDESGDKPPAPTPQHVGQPIPPDRVKAREHPKRFGPRARRRVTIQRHREVLANSLEGGHLVEDTLKQHGRQIPLTIGSEDDDNRLSLVLGTLG